MDMPEDLESEGKIPIEEFMEEIEEELGPFECQKCVCHNCKDSGCSQASCDTCLGVGFRSCSHSKEMSK